MKENDYVQKIHELEQELKIRIEDNAELYKKLCNALMQLNDANELIKRYKGVFSWCASNIHGGQNFEKDIQEYIKKWGVK